MHCGKQKWKPRKASLRWRNGSKNTYKKRKISQGELKIRETQAFIASRTIQHTDEYSYPHSTVRLMVADTSTDTVTPEEDVSVGNCKEPPPGPQRQHIIRRGSKKGYGGVRWRFKSFVVAMPGMLAW